MEAQEAAVPMEVPPCAEGAGSPVWVRGEVLRGSQDNGGAGGD